MYKKNCMYVCIPSQFTVFIKIVNKSNTMFIKIEGNLS